MAPPVRSSIHLLPPPRIIAYVNFDTILDFLLIYKSSLIANFQFHDSCIALWRIEHLHVIHCSCLFKKTTDQNKLDDDDKTRILGDRFTDMKAFDVAIKITFFLGGCGDMKDISGVHI